jgi:hypothetical protein
MAIDDSEILKIVYGQKPYRTICLKQPFAGLMLHGKVETRWIRNGRKSPFPLGAYMIYSSKAAYPYDDAKDIAGDQWPKILEIAETDKNLFRDASPICMAKLVKIIDPLIVEDHTDIKTFCTIHDPDSCYHMVGLVFEEVRAINHFEFKGGKQGVGFLDDQYIPLIDFVHH